MESKIVRCPGCNVGLKVENPRDEAVKRITCPQCGTPLKVIFRADNDPSTQLAGGGRRSASASDGSTQLSGHGGQPDATNVMPRAGKLVCNGVEYPLQMGRNVVGRKNTTRPAQVMLDVDDSYMSRQHVCVTVAQHNGRTRATVENFQNTNDTEVAGLPLSNGEVIVLTNGMTIKMGNTTVTYRS